jgi:hypothetical protein
MQAAFRTGGVQIELNCRRRFLSGVLEEGLAGQLSPAQVTRPDIRVTVENDVAAFDTHGWDVLTRNAWRRAGQVVVRDACSSGLDLLVATGGPGLEILARWRPPPTGRLAAAALRSRSRLLTRAVLLQYPALWWGQQHGRAPLHASVCSLGTDHGRSVLIAGPGGIGKSTIVNAELERGAVATSDNLCVSDGHTAWGVLEPRRVPAGERGSRRGRRMPHDRREAPWQRRVDDLVPGLVLVLRRGTAKMSSIAPCDPDQAARSLVAGTYMAGELRRYWAFASTLAFGTGVGEVHPSVDQVARSLTAGLPCWELTRGQRPIAPLASFFAPTLAGDGVGR